MMICFGNLHVVNHAMPLWILKTVNVRDCGQERAHSDLLPFLPHRSLWWSGVFILVRGWTGFTLPKCEDLFYAAKVVVRNEEQNCLLIRFTEIDKFQTHTWKRGWATGYLSGLWNVEIWVGQTGLGLPWNKHTMTTLSFHSIRWWQGCRTGLSLHARNDNLIRSGLDFCTWSGVHKLWMNIWRARDITWHGNQDGLIAKCNSHGMCNYHLISNTHDKSIGRTNNYPPSHCGLEFN